jgi:ATP-dependent Clp protease ATP-binding subunit ClpB
MDHLRVEIEQAQRAYDYNKAAELQYGRAKELDARLQQEEEKLARLQTSGKLLKEEVDSDDIADVVSRWTGIPVSRLMEGEIEKLIQMETRLHGRVIGQDEAIQAVSDAIRRSRAGLSDPNRPLGSFIFLGPTGVGKTELARALAEFMFDSEGAMIRIDMSEYMEKHAVSRLIGAPPGYVGYDEGGQLSEAIRRRPYSVILFDEIEKAHPDVFNILLQVLDDGRLTDGQGRVVDFRNTVVIMTSNLGSQAILGMNESNVPEIRAKVMDALRANFRPEFLNRVDETIIFTQLSRDQIGEIVDLQLDDLSSRLAQRGMRLHPTLEARELLITLGYEPAYGARPLKRVIQKRLLDPLALRLLSGQIREGEDVELSVENGEFVIQGQLSAAEVVA